MKQNGNDQQLGDYYVGLDIGTDSVGFAVTDAEYRLCRYGGNSMWGIRLFDEGKTAQERRQFRTNRRRLARQKWRLSLLRELFDEEITKIDSGFFMRLQESSLHREDKKSGTAYSVFADPKYTDKNYLKTYPTVYHLRLDLIQNPVPHDIRLVYLALHHIIKSRGHFLFEIGDGGSDFTPLLEELLTAVTENIGMEITVTDRKEFHRILSADGMKKREKVGLLLALIRVSSNEELDPKKVKKAAEKFTALLVGNKVRLQELFIDRELPNAGSIALSDSEQAFEEAVTKLEDAGDVLLCAKSVYDCLTLERITGTAQWLSEYKISEYEQHGRDVRQLKQYVKKTLKNEKLYKDIFVHQKEKLNNYCAYSGYKKSDTVTRCSHEAFCEYLRKVLPKESEDAEIQKMLDRIAEGTFAPKLRSSDNGVIPNALHRKELEKILFNAEAYLPFLKEKDAYGRTVTEKIRAIFSFRIPYYVGPLGKTDRGWAVRSEEKIYPWNFSEVVNMEESAAGFILRMTSRCTYTGDDVLPKDSLLYSEFTVLNEINNIKVNGEALPVEIKQRLYEDLFVKQNRKVTKKKIHEALVALCHAKKTDTISGVNDTLTSNLSSYHKLKNIIPQVGEVTAEEIIRRSALYGEDKSLLRKWLKENTPLSDEDIRYVSKLKFSEWGRLSASLLTEFCHTDPRTGESYSIIERMRSTNENLMQLLSSRYSFLKMAQSHKRSKLPVVDSLRAAVEDLYVSPKVRRSIWQTMRILDEIVDIRKALPKKIFIEVARDQNDKNEKKMTVSRKDRLIELYKACKKEHADLLEQLMAEDESKLRSDKLYLYYTQFGRCMYTGEMIDIAKLGDNGLYDIDHIFPRSKIKDDGLDNRVLVLANANRLKTNHYPLDSATRIKMRPFWKILLKKGLISEKKYERLTRHTELTEEELSSFVNRQLVETRQSTKAVAELLQQRYPQVRIVYSKAGNVSEFRQQFGFVKCREVNDHHHAKDAYLNIVVGNYYDTRFTEKFFRNIKAENYSLRPDVMYKYDVPRAWDGRANGTILTVKKMMGKNNVLYTRQPLEISGQLYDLQILKKGKGQIPVKEGREIEKYGGYNMPTGSYFALIEYPAKKKIIRKLVAVLLVRKAEYERDPAAFARKYWDPEARIIVKKIPTGSLLEIDGVRMHITGRSGSQNKYNHANQLILSEKDIASLKSIAKYVERCNEKKTELVPYKKDGVSKEENLRLYDLFIAKLKIPAYAEILASMCKHMENNRDKYETMSLLEQCKLIVEILKAFRCNAQRPSFKELCGVGEVGVVQKSSTISSCNTVRLIHQSVTGLFETEVDLLK